MATTRRDVFGLMGGAALAAATPAWAQAPAVVEWNAHMFSRNIKRFPFHPRATYKPDATTFPADPLATYQRHLKALGIDKAVVVQPEPYGDDHSLVLDCLRRAPASQLKATSLFYPKDPQAPKKLAALVK